MDRRPQSQLSVHVSGTTVGTISRNPRGSLRFLPDENWLDGGQSPPLGLAFLQNPRPKPSPPHLPPWFENLLPEGVMRSWLCRKHGLRISDSVGLLTILGADLAGAVVVDGAIPQRPGHREPEVQGGADAKKYRFSLAGLQLKLSMSLSGARFSFPAAGDSGRWIVKLPDPARPNLPEVENATMLWARASGIEVPKCHVLEMEQLEGLEESLVRERPRAFAVERFDRLGDGRVHQEDFAQALWLKPEDKYGDAGISVSYDGLGRLIADACGPGARDDYIRRVGFVLASGNDDAHLKNWSFQWGQDHRPRLSPAYDQVSTLTYRLSEGWVRDGPTLALALGRERQWSRVTQDHVRRFARRTGAADGYGLFLEGLERAAAAWPTVADSAPEPMRQAIKRLWTVVPILRRVGLTT